MSSTSVSGDATGHLSDAETEEKSVNILLVCMSFEFILNRNRLFFEFNPC